MAFKAMPLYLSTVIEGCYFNVVGFPVAVFEKLCRKSGIDLLNDLTDSLITHLESANLESDAYPQRNFSRSSLKKVLPNGSASFRVDCALRMLR